MTTIATPVCGERCLQSECGWLLSSLVMFVILAMTLAGCAAKATRTQELIAKDYVEMTNDDLLLYYYQIEDQIEAEESRSTGSSVSVGIGTGFFGSGSHLGGGVGVSTGVGQRETAAELRDRRNAVRLELQKRGLQP